MNKELQERYIMTRNKLRTLLDSYNVVADKIAEKYDDNDIDQFDLMCDEQEDMRASMGIAPVEQELHELENELLKEFEHYCRSDAAAALHMNFSNNEIDQLFTTGIGIYSTRKKLVELALQA